jgi:hypothetical protein
MPSVFVVPVYVEVPGGFERSVMALESHLRRAGYVFHVCEPLFETLDETKKALGLGVHAAAERNSELEGGATAPEFAESNQA